MILRKSIFSIAAAALILAPGFVQAEELMQQTAEVIDFATGGSTRNAAILTRADDDVSVRLSLMDLDKKSAYTVWWVVFNLPENCLTAWACGEGDIFTAPGVPNGAQVEAVGISLFYAAGFVTGTDGTINLSAELESGDLPMGSFDVLFPGGLHEGNGRHAEMHMVFRSHGESIAGQVAAQTSTFDGECQTCEDQLAAIFQSPSAP